ncbi:MAG: hypothetical protein IKJ87_03460 [Ruminococcus sp.]|nr:hypothetical protein [Ruminococcus sp.]
MDTGRIKTLFELFCGEECSAQHEPIIELAMLEVEKMLHENADANDIRLNYLCAAMANLRYYQALTASDRSTFTYGGKMLEDKEKKILHFAEGLLKGYFRLCSDLIKGDEFIFIGVT